MAQTGTFLTEWEVWSSLSLSSQWTASLHRIGSRQAPVSSLLPQQCLLEMEGLAAASVWPPPRRTRARRSGAHRHRAAASSAATSGSLQDGEVVATDANQEGGQGASMLEDLQSGDEEEASDYEEPLADEEEVSELEMMLASLLEAGDTGVLGGDGPLDVLEAELLREPGPVQEEQPANLAPENAAQLEPPVEGQEDQGPAGVLQEGAAAAAVVPPPPPPPPPRRAAAGADVGRGRADMVMGLHGGQIAFYANKHIFQATCGNGAHGRCVLTRSAAGGSRAAQGRPLGLLSAWLELGNNTASKDQHWDRTTQRGFDEP